MLGDSAHKTIVQNLASTKKDNEDLMLENKHLKAELIKLRVALVQEKELRMKIQKDSLATSEQVSFFEKKVRELEEELETLPPLKISSGPLSRVDLLEQQVADKLSPLKISSGPLSRVDLLEKRVSNKLSHSGNKMSIQFGEEIVNDGMAKAIREANESMARHKEAISRRRTEVMKEVDDYAKIHEKANMYRRETMELRMKLLGKDNQLEEQDNRINNLESALDEARQTNEDLLKRLTELESVVNAKEEEDMMSPVVRRSNPRRSIKYAVDVQ